MTRLTLKLANYRYTLWTDGLDDSSIRFGLETIDLFRKDPGNWVSHGRFMSYLKGLGAHIHDLNREKFR